MIVDSISDSDFGINNKNWSGGGKNNGALATNSQKLPCDEKMD